MIPFDGSGYGVSMYWRNTMKEIAEKNCETCECWEKQEPIMNFINGEDVLLKIECRKKTEQCKVDFNMTQIEFMRKFKEFYKV